MSSNISQDAIISYEIASTVMMGKCESALSIKFGLKFYFLRSHNTILFQKMRLLLSSLIQDKCTHPEDVKLCTVIVKTNGTIPSNSNKGVCKCAFI